MDTNKFTLVFGLTADPIHKGHEQAIINGVEFCRENGIEIEQFLLVPVYQPNLIADKNPPVASFEQRFFMCELVANRLSKKLGCDIQVSRIEKELLERTGEKNFSVNTIKAFAENRGLTGEVPAFATNLLFMVSADHFAGRWPKFRKWYKWREILQYSGLLINQRPGNNINHNFIAELRQINPHVFVVQNSHVIDVSSTKIRQGIDAKSLVRLISSDVMDTIKNQGLY